MWVEPPVAEIVEIATSIDSLPKRAGRLLQSLQRWMPFDAAWLAVCDPRSTVYSTVASTGMSGPASGRRHDVGVVDEVWADGPQGGGLVASVTDLARPVDEAAGWAQCLARPGDTAGSAVVVGLVEPGGLRVGAMGLRFPRGDALSPSAHQRLAEVAPLIARAISPVRALSGTARLVHGATAGAALFRDGSTRPLPGLCDDALLVAGSPVLDIARAALLAGMVFRSFLWPVHEGLLIDHVRVSVLAATGLPSFVLGTVMVTPDADLQGLTPRELEVLGLLVDGRSNQQMARTLAVAPRTIAAHVEHVLEKLDVPTRTLAAVHAERDGCYVPSFGSAAAR